VTSIFAELLPSVEATLRQVTVAVAVVVTVNASLSLFTARRGWGIASALWSFAALAAFNVALVVSTYEPAGPRHAPGKGRGRLPRVTSIRTVRATRYVVPLREGGSLPGVVEADDLGIYVCKFRGAGQGLRVLVAEVVVGELARRLGIAVPELVSVELEEEIAKYEADEEVQDLLTASLGLNLGIDFLPGAFGFDSACRPDAEDAAAVIWLDAFTANVDRSWRNPNLLMWHGRLWAIDHGACLYFHHSWSSGITDPARFAVQPYRIEDHVLSAYLSGVADADARLAPQVTEGLLRDVVRTVPEAWLEPVPGADAEQVRTAYVDFLLARASGARPWLPGGAA
jgi:hypothetical protein